MMSRMPRREAGPVPTRARGTLGFTCVLCGPSSGRRVYSVGQWSVACCQRCELLRTLPVPDAATLGALYEDQRYYRTRSDPSPDVWLARAREILAVLPSLPRSLVDFGAGEGRLVRSFRHVGLVSEGIEPSATGRASAERELGVKLWQQFPTHHHGYFGAATLLHSLEHVLDPVATLAGLRPLLAPRGLLFIEVPHAASFDMLIPGQRRAILDLPFHLHHFSPKTLDLVVAAAGYETIVVRLFNATPVEALLRWRAAWAPGAGTSTSEAAGAAQPEILGRSPRTALRSTLHGVRRLLPGGKLQLIAAALERR
ncbi:MAG: class I SAM-dependent methyltransferase [Solirubrobacteraceae bacterium]